MHFKKIVLTASIVLFLLGIISVSSASAAAAWYTCTVQGTGIGYGSIYIELTDTATNPSFTGKWFVAKSDQQNQTLAAALTAQSNGLKVYVYTDPSVPQASRVLYTFYVLSN